MALHPLSQIVCLLALFDVPPDAQVATLIEQLGNPRYREREVASETLAELGWRAIRQLEAGRSHPDAEISSRCRRLVDHYYAVLPSNYARLPWIDMLPVNLKHQQKHYLDQAGWNQSTRHGDDWPNYRYATYLWSRDLLRKGVPRAFMVSALDDMASREMEYRRRHGMPP